MKNFRLYQEHLKIGDTIQILLVHGSCFGVIKDIDFPEIMIQPADEDALAIMDLTKVEGVKFGPGVAAMLKNIQSQTGDHEIFIAMAQKAMGGINEN
jgi:hypothetical protein